MNRAAILMSTVLALSAAWPSSVEAWDPFRTRNDSVEDGNARMADGDATGALASYDQAAQELPNEPRVQLNRGLALMAADQLPEAREAFLRAADPDAPAEVRADAYYDLGLAFYREGDAASGEEDHQAAQASFREAADAFRRSLRAKPGNRDAAWNLELALRRIREEEEKQEQQEQEQQEQQNQDQQDQEGQQQSEDQQQQDQEGDQEGQEQNQDQEGDQGQDQQQDQEGEQEGQDQQEGDQGDPGEDEQDEGGEGPEEQDQGADENEGEQDSNEQEGQGGEEPQDGEGGGQRLPGHVERVLDALEDDEESLQRARARARALRENRRVTMDW